MGGRGYRPTPTVSWPIGSRERPCGALESRAASWLTRALATPRIGKGWNNGEIAGRLVLSESTVRTHVGRVLAKLGARDQAQAVIFAYDMGLTRPGATEEQLTGTSGSPPPPGRLPME